MYYNALNHLILILRVTMGVITSGLPADYNCTTCPQVWYCTVHYQLLWEIIITQLKYSFILYYKYVDSSSERVHYISMCTVLFYIFFLLSLLMFVQ